MNRRCHCRQGFPFAAAAVVVVAGDGGADPEPGDAVVAAVGAVSTSRLQRTAVCAHPSVAVAAAAVEV